MMMLIVVAYVCVCAWSWSHSPGDARDDPEVSDGGVQRSRTRQLKQEHPPQPVRVPEGCTTQGCPKTPQHGQTTYTHADRYHTITPPTCPVPTLPNYEFLFVLLLARCCEMFLGFKWG